MPNARRAAPHGEWGPFLKELGLPERTALRCMLVADRMKNLPDAERGKLTTIRALLEGPAPAPGLGGVSDSDGPDGGLQIRHVADFTLGYAALPDGRTAIAGVGAAGRPSGLTPGRLRPEPSRGGGELTSEENVRDTSFEPRRGFRRADAAWPAGRSPRGQGRKSRPSSDAGTRGREAPTPGARCDVCAELSPADGSPTAFRTDSTATHSSTAC